MYMDDQQALRGHVNLMGRLLGNAIRMQRGDDFFRKIETIRTLSKSARAGDTPKGAELVETLNNLKDEELLPVVRAFSQFLNMANIAEQYHTARPGREGNDSLLETPHDAFEPPVLSIKAALHSRPACTGSNAWIIVICNHRYQALLLSGPETGTQHPNISVAATPPLLLSRVIMPIETGYPGRSVVNAMTLCLSPAG